jgi:uncharacterized protein
VRRVLSIDGGGVRGLVPALVLDALERRTGRSVADLFDVVAGTSTGAILALGLLHPGPSGRPSWRARDLVELYETSGATIFTRSAVRCLQTLNGYLAPKYDGDVLTALLQRQFGETPLRAALRDVLVTAYDARRRTPYFFRTGRPSCGAEQPMWLVARASAAAPTYFTPARVVDEIGDRWLVDGGVFASSPAMCAWTEACHAPGAFDDVLVASLGTGELSADYATVRMRRGGALLWARPLFDVMLDGQENVTDEQLRRLLPSDRYFRFQPDLSPRCQRIDDASAENTRQLHESVRRLLERDGARLEQLAALLTREVP